MSNLNIEYIIAITMKLLNENVLTQQGDINADAMELKGNDRFGDNRNYQKYSSKEHVGSAIVTENVIGTVGNINLRDSAFIAEKGDKLNIGNVKVESAVNEYDTESRSRSKGMLSSRKSYTESHTEKNAAETIHANGSFTNVDEVHNNTGTMIIRGFNQEGGKVTGNMGKVEGRQRKTGTDEKGLESTGRASNEYFSEKYKDDNPAINIQSDGKDYSNVDFGENVGDIAPAIAIGAGMIIVYIAGTYAVQQNGKTIGTYPDLKTAQKNTQYLLDGIGSGLKWVWNGGAWVVEQGGRIFGKESTKNNKKSNPDQVKSSQEKYEEAKKEFDDLNKKPNKSKEDNEKLKDLKKQKEHWRKKAQEESEIHARKAQGGKNQGGGNSRGR